MKKKFMIFSIIAFFMFCNTAFAQEDKPKEETTEMAVLNHKVSLGETVMMIAKKYMVRPQDIYEINPDAVEGITGNMVIKIPADKIKAKLKPEQKSSIRKERVPKKSFD